MTALGLVVSAVTVFLMYDERVLCGVLSFLGAAMILSGVLDRVLPKNAVNTWTREPAEQERPSSAGGASALIGFAVCCLLFYITRWVNRGFLRLWPGRTLILPAFLFTEGIPGAILTAVGFPMKDFFSTDYFSMIPWFFLFRAGFYLHQIMRGRGWFSSPVFHCRIPPLNRMERAFPADLYAASAGPLFADASVQPSEIRRKICGNLSDKSGAFSGGMCIM